VQTPGRDWPFALTEIFNSRPAGFGANHNIAFSHCTTSFFCVLNPDVQLLDDTVWENLLGVANAGCAYPSLLNRDGTPQDSERAVMTPANLVRRHVLRRPERAVDWVNASFWLLPAEVWRVLGGFDERYYMYCEDSEFCLRLQLAGLRLVRGSSQAVHAGARRSRSNGRHLMWHLRSLVRFWFSDTLRLYRQRRAAG